MFLEEHDTLWNWVIELPVYVQAFDNESVPKKENPNFGAWMNFITFQNLHKKDN